MKNRSPKIMKSTRLGFPRIRWKKRKGITFHTRPPPPQRLTGPARQPSPFSFSSTREEIRQHRCRRLLYSRAGSACEPRISTFEERRSRVLQSTAARCDDLFRRHFRPVRQLTVGGGDEWEVGGCGGGGGPRQISLIYDVLNSLNYCSFSFLDSNLKRSCLEDGSGPTEKSIKTAPSIPKNKDLRVVKRGYCLKW